MSSLRCNRRLLPVAAFLALVASVLAIGNVAQAGTSACQAKNLTTGGVGEADLQRVINAAQKDDVVQVAGNCVGFFVIRRDLTVVGKSTAAFPHATLDGNDVTQVLLVRLKSTDVTLIDLTITGGVGNRGGGILVKHGSLALSGSTSVTANAARQQPTAGGGGIFNNRGLVTLNDSSRVMDNYARHNGGGIFNLSGVVVLNNTSTISGNESRHVAGTGGGGIFTSTGEVTMNDSSSVAGNSAHFLGGGITGGAITLNDESSVTGNIAQEGGGIYLRGGSAALNGSSSVTDNSATVYGGGIRGFRFNPVTLRDTAAVTGNTAQTGGGIYTTGSVEVCDNTGTNPWTGMISPNNPDDPPTPLPITCS
ncbi:MAG TPA: hypothetical protein VMT88_09830 [Actinomycetes bacterium]|nr:hypothetical protein [Actinomycetes bacterium]